MIHVAGMVRFSSSNECICYAVHRVHGLLVSCHKMLTQTNTALQVRGGGLSLRVMILFSQAHNKFFKAVQRIFGDDRALPVHAGMLGATSTRYDGRNAALAPLLSDIDYLISQPFHTEHRTRPCARGPHPHITVNLVKTTPSEPRPGEMHLLPF